MTKVNSVLAFGMVWFSLLSTKVFCAQWLEVGDTGGATRDKVLLDTQDIKSVGSFRVFGVLTVYPAARLNKNNIFLDSHVQVTAIDCEKKTFIGIKTTGLLKGKKIGDSPETPDWKNKMKPLKTDALSQHLFEAVCQPGGKAGAPSAHDPTHLCSQANAVVI